MQGRRSMVVMVALAAAAMWLGSPGVVRATNYFTCSAHPGRNYVDNCSQAGVAATDPCLRPELGCCAPGTCKSDGMGGLFCDPPRNEINCSESPDNPCTTDTCTTAGGSYPDPGYYEAVCVHTNNTSPCSDGNKCTGTGTSGTDQCSGGVCQPGAPNSNSCNDGNTCTHNDHCAGGSCTGDNDPDGTSCTDGSNCTDPDTCQNGVCTGPDICSSMQYNTECATAVACVAGNCMPTPADGSNGTNCDDGRECTSSSQCFDGVCGGPGHYTIGNPGASCWDHDYCKTPGSCDGSHASCPGAGRVSLALHAACDDHNSCTQNTTCECPAGKTTCTSGARVCTVPASNGCNLNTTCVNCGGSGCLNGTPLGFPCGCTDINQNVPG